MNVCVFDVGCGKNICVFVCVCVSKEGNCSTSLKSHSSLEKGRVVGTLTDDTNFVGNMFPRIYRVLFISKLSKDPEKENAVGKMTYYECY